MTFHWQGATPRCFAFTGTLVSAFFFTALSLARSPLILGNHVRLGRPDAHRIASPPMAPSFALFVRHHLCPFPRCRRPVAVFLSFLVLFAFLACLDVARFRILTRRCLPGPPCPLSGRDIAAPSLLGPSRCAPRCASAPSRAPLAHVRECVIRLPPLSGEAVAGYTESRAPLAPLPARRRLLAPFAACRARLFCRCTARASPLAPLARTGGRGRAAFARPSTECFDRPL